MNNENRKIIPYKLLPKRNIIKAAKAIKNAVRRAAEFKENELNKRIVEEIESY